MFAAAHQRGFSRCTHKRAFLNLCLSMHSFSLPRSPAENKTIYALSTPPGKGGVAVVRISGPETRAVWRSVLRPFPASVAKGNTNGIEEESLDDGLAVFFEAPNSYTTEPTMELHLHSSPATLRRVFALLSRLPGVRPAERGEFTKRAYLAGRIDLLQAEGLRDLIDAETETQRKTAWNALHGNLSVRLEGLRAQVVGALAMIEALIDFGEGEDIEENSYETARQHVLNLRDTIINHINDSHRGEMLRSGIKISIFGPPNAGKSSLLNFLAQRDAAIVTPIPGTTRDVLETSLDIAGLPVRLFDTAGIRHTEDLVEKIGVEKARNAVQGADLSLCVLTLSQYLEEGGIPSSVKPLFTPMTLVLLNKMDLIPSASNKRTGSKMWKVSLATGEGVSEFVTGLGELLRDHYNFHVDQSPLVTQSRHRAHLQRAVEFLDAFLQNSQEDVVMAAEELRYAGKEIGKIIGGVDVKDVLNAIFKEFCIGK